jgi:hypothetical protein
MPSRRTFWLAVFPSLLFVFLAVTGQITDIVSWPGFGNLNNCIQQVFGQGYGPGNSYDIRYRLGCGQSWSCVCNSLNLAGPQATSLASTFCSGRTQDIAAATSVLNGFCAQLYVTPSYDTSTAQKTATATAQGIGLFETILKQGSQGHTTVVMTSTDASGNEMTSTAIVDTPVSHGGLTLAEKIGIAFGVLGSLGAIATIWMCLNKWC